jgi:hypothetical protein
VGSLLDYLHETLLVSQRDAETHDLENLFDPAYD